MAELHQDESASLGQLMQLTAQALNQALKPAKVHFGIYAETVKHIHVHVFPRMTNMPAGNIPNLWIGQWLNVLHMLKMKKAYSDEVVAEYARRLSVTYQELSKGQ
jgi:diadenosine tetraphosphate (Ap4A) HIT family hydrolase